MGTRLGRQGTPDKASCSKGSRHEVEAGTDTGQEFRNIACTYRDVVRNAKAQVQLILAIDIKGKKKSN